MVNEQVTTDDDSFETVIPVIIDVVAAGTVYTVTVPLIDFENVDFSVFDIKRPFLREYHC